LFERLKDMSKTDWKYLVDTLLFLFWAFCPRVPGAYEDYGVRAGRQARAGAFQEDPSSILIHGQMTLHDREEE